MRRTGHRSGWHGALVATAVSLVAVGAGCGSKASMTAIGCEPGRTERCDCPFAPPGLKICQVSGQYGGCACTAPLGGDASSADVAARPVDAPTEPACRKLVCGADVLCGTESDGCGGTVSCGICLDRARTLSLQARALVADPKRQLLYATVAGDSPDHPNTIVTVDPVTATVKSALPIGANPGALALADDGNTLWVGIDGALAIRRVDLGVDPPVAGPLHSLPTDQFGAAMTAVAILPLSGAPLTVAVTTTQGSTMNGVVVLDDGVARPTSVPWYMGPANLVAGPPNTLFGTTSYSFYVLTVSATGVTSKEFTNMGDSGALAYGGGRVYSAAGAVYDVNDVTHPLRLGRFSIMGTIFPEAGKTQVLMASSPTLTGSGGPYLMRLVDTVNFAQVRSKAVANLAASTYTFPCRLGAATFALLASRDNFGASLPRLSTSVAIFDTSVAQAPDAGP